jgi:hypothetical protein
MFDLVRYPQWTTVLVLPSVRLRCTEASTNRKAVPLDSDEQMFDHLIGERVEARRYGHARPIATCL